MGRREAEPSPWISAADRIPANGQWVVVLWRFGGAIHYELRQIAVGDVERWDRRHFTHWMPIPPVPESRP